MDGRIIKYGFNMVILLPGKECYDRTGKTSKSDKTQSKNEQLFFVYDTFYNCYSSYSLFNSIRWNIFYFSVCNGYDMPYGCTLL